LEKFHPSRNKNEKIGEGGIKTILFVGGLDRAHYFKGLEILLQAAAGLADRFGGGKVFDWRLLIIGDGELKPRYEKIAVDSGIADRVEFCGAAGYDELPGYYRRADLVVLPSVTRGEAFGLVLLEAMASGIPVIASGLPGVRKVFKDGVQGFLIEPGDARDLAEKIGRILSDDGLREKMGRAGRKLTEEKYDRKKIGDQLVKIVKM
jgi:glycosyltransferase involved in cell wall biosynthesis